MDDRMFPFDNKNNEINYNNYTNDKFSSYYDSTYNNESKKKKTHSIWPLLIVITLIMCLFFIAIGTRNLIKNKQPTETKYNAATLSISELSDTTGLSAKEIYEKSHKSNVGIILYNSNSSLFSSRNASNASIVGEGSGIVMSSENGQTYIITCAHVISKAKTQGYTITVQDYNNKQYDAQIVGYDSKTDIGVIAIKADGFTAAEFGDSSLLSVGETVYALGNPGGTGFFGSFTRGMISAIDRPVNNEIGYDMKCIQHDAAISPGNSGGMLLNSVGQVIGINSSKIVSTEYEGIGFSIPITSAKPIIDDIIAHGYVTNRAKLGISYAPASKYQGYSMIVAMNKLPTGSLVIAHINNDSALNGTSAQVGDMIIAVDGKDMETADVLLEKVEKGHAGDKLKITLARVDENYQIKKFDVSIKLVEDKGIESNSKNDSESNSYEDYLKQFVD